MAKTGKAAFSSPYTHAQRIALLKQYDALDGDRGKWLKSRGMKYTTISNWRKRDLNRITEQKKRAKAKELVDDLNASHVVEIPKTVTAPYKPSDLAGSIEGYIEILKVERRMIDRMIADQEELLGVGKSGRAAR